MRIETKTVPSTYYIFDVMHVPVCPRPGHSGAFDKRSLLKLQNAPHLKVRFFRQSKLTTPLTSPALAEWKTQANVNGLNLICQVIHVTAYNVFKWYKMFVVSL